jgi:hypothetical protein
MRRDDFDRTGGRLRQRARGELAATRGRDAAWGYRRGQAPSVEPTALACLGLLASSDPAALASDRSACHDAARWIVSIGRDDGSVPPSRDVPTPGWATPYAILLWNSLNGYDSARRRSASWLLQLEGKTHPRSARSDQVIGHDSTLIGWPWVEQTHSWLEPTALAILALCREGLGDHPRVAAGVALILDRALDAGGWNYGGKAVFGRPLRPQPGPTGLALLALAARRVQSDAVSNAVTYLRTSLPAVRSAVSLGWGVLGLRSQGACPAVSIDWLSESLERCAVMPDAAFGLALLLLAASERALGLLGAGSGTLGQSEQPPQANRADRAAACATARLTHGTPS